MKEEGPILYSEAVEAACWTVEDRDARASGRPPERLGIEGQRKRREAEWTVHGFVVRSVEKLKDLGMKVSEIARFLLMPARTLFDWVGTWRKEPPAVLSRGRPPKAGTIAQRMAVWESLEWCGPATGVDVLKKSHPELSRGMIAEIKKDFVESYRIENRREIQALIWHGPGRVWAMDFGHFPNLVAGMYKHFLPVKDLASKAMLDVFPTRDEKAKTVRKLLEVLFAIFGPPLVIKADNGSGFIDSKLRGFLESYGVKILLSPARLPSYNGGAEAGVGSLKNHAFDHALVNGDPCEWTLDDVHAGKTRCNEQNQIDRYALRKALVECGYLSFQRRRITPHIRKRNRARIS